MKNLENRYVCYYRVSTEKQDLDTQKAIIRNYLKEEYIDCEFQEIESGKHMSTNKELYEAVKYCKENDKILAVSTLDRLGRDAEHALKIHRELNGWLFAGNLPNEYGTRMDRFMLTLFMAFAERERELISIITTLALRERMKQGVTTGPKKPLSQVKQRKRNLLASRTWRMKKYNDPAYKQIADYIVSRVEEYKMTGNKVNKDHRRNGGDIYEKIANEMNDLKIPKPKYLGGITDEKFNARYIAKVYNDETKSVQVEVRH